MITPISYAFGLVLGSSIVWNLGSFFPASLWSLQKKPRKDEGQIQGSEQKDRGKRSKEDWRKDQVRAS